MALFASQFVTHTSLRSSFIADPITGLLHRGDCPARPPSGIGFRDQHTATAQGYVCCECAVPALVASAERIRTLLATTLAKPQS